jgi:hypothetical protein
VSASLVDMLGRPTAPVAACRDAAATLAGISANDAGAIAACGAQVPAAMVTLARRMLRLLPLAAALGGPGDPILRDVLFHACRCLAVLAYHPDGKVRACLGGGGRRHAKDAGGAHARGQANARRQVSSRDCASLP